ncbi:hypothetical protein VE01_07069 [Pseudogymnoascus verrucosus]|uniref:N-acetyltransferase domain-containing protein n=1 Tax=Pseudogymnoascus verrucosus TaxID=342668 RepID=A0A1B8GE18_9PEZI|nr:uncharacterized protein VE01_07069 [Pseudogymnoascus verrucosus]OBT94076.2 hypothetical protein VE01_07069 [Pseudogymnoascus verrucosus]
MAFELQPLNAIADLEEIIQLMVVTLYTQEPMKTILGNASPEDKWTLLSHSIRDWLTKPGAVGLKMVESSTNKIVSFFIVQRPHSMTDNEKAAGSSSMEYPLGMNKELAREFYGISVGLRRRNGFDPARDYSGSIIATLPDYQGQGHGRRLVETGLKMADTESKTWYAGCWPASVPLYKKVGGFDYITEESINMSLHGGEGVVSMRLFVRKPNVTTI